MGSLFTGAVKRKHAFPSKKLIKKKPVLPTLSIFIGYSSLTSAYACFRV